MISGFSRPYVLNSDLIVSVHLHILPELREIVDQVISEGVVVIYHQYHVYNPFLAASTAFTSAFTLFTVSSNSLSVDQSPPQCRLRPVCISHRL